MVAELEGRKPESANHPAIGRAVWPREVQS
jgi:hypothetical protein